MASHVLLAEVSSESEGKHAWTVLSLWWRADEQRPFVAVVEGRVSSSAAARMLNRFRAAAFGSLASALNSFDASDLRDELLAKIPVDVAEHYPDGDTIRMREAAKRRQARGYNGPAELLPMLRWLYEDALTLSDNAMANRVEADFGVKARTVRDALTTGKPLTGWGIAFLSAMRHFDRGAWARVQAEKADAA
ncbi:MAG: hypothetical protein ABW128_07095 [Rhizorhabdus sp.]